MSYLTVDAEPVFLVIGTPAQYQSGISQLKMSTLIRGWSVKWGDRVAAAVGSTQESEDVFPSIMVQADAINVFRDMISRVALPEGRSC
jgi:hypothetical protein